MKTLIVSLLIASTAILTGCVDDRAYQGGPGYGRPAPHIDNRWRDDRGRYDRDRDRDRGRYNRDDSRGDDRRDWRDRRGDDRSVRYDQYGRPILYPNR